MPLNGLAVFLSLVTLWCTTLGTATQLPLQTSLAVVSQQPFHLEVLAGVLYVAAPLVTSISAYVHERNLDGGRLSFGFSKWFASHHHLQGFPLQPLGAMQTMAAVDVLLLISPEYESPGNLKRLLNYARPRVSTLFLVHNSDALRLPSLHAMLRSNFRRKSIRGDNGRQGSRPYFLALAPHVAEAVARRLNINVTWMLPVHPAVPVTKTPVCKQMQAMVTSWTASEATAQNKQQSAVHVPLARACDGGGSAARLFDGDSSSILCSTSSRQSGGSKSILGKLQSRRGFVVQGRADAGRRDFRHLWQALAEADANFGGNVTELNLLVLASGSKRPTIAPLSVSHLVKTQRNAAYKAFYAGLSSAAALLPALGSEAYLRCTLPQAGERTAPCGTKLTSSILASLATNTPIIANAEFLGTYGFLDPEATWAHPPGASLGEALEMVAASDASAREQKAGCVGAVREMLNAQSQRQLLRMFQADDS